MKKKTEMKKGSEIAHKDAFILVARLFIAALFLSSFIGKLAGFSGQAAWIGSSGFPMPELLLICAMILEAIGIVSLVTGCRVHVGATALIIFTLAASFMFHIGDGQMTAFLKNLAIVGGLLLLAIQGSGKYALKF